MTCKTCCGTGQVLCLKSMFLGDGFRRERCGVCAGSGKSSFRDDPVYVRWQARARLAEAAMRQAPKGLDYIELGRIAQEAMTA